MFFHFMKTGCKIEAPRLGQIDLVERALVLDMNVARRVARLMRLGRTCPDLDAVRFFDADAICGFCASTSTGLISKMKSPRRSCCGPKS